MKLFRRSSAREFKRSKMTICGSAAAPLDASAVSDEWNLIYTGLGYYRGGARGRLRYKRRLRCTAGLLIAAGCWSLSFSSAGFYNLTGG